MTAADLLYWFRNAVIAEPYQDRIDDDLALTLLAQASRDVAKATRAIEGKIGIQVGIRNPQTQQILSEWNLPVDEIVAIRRVYMVTPGSCIRLKHTSIPQMEGDQLRIYNDFEQAHNNNPAWTVFPAAPYPVSRCFVGVGYSPLPMYPGAPPSYYLRGLTRIGTVPAPLAPATLLLDIYAMPGDFKPVAQVAAADQPCLLPLDFKPAICWKAAAQFYHSDQSVGSDSLEQDALANYGESIKDLVSYTDNFNEDDPQGPQILTHRAFYNAQRMGTYW